MAQFVLGAFILAGAIAAAYAVPKAAAGLGPGENVAKNVGVTILLVALLLTGGIIRHGGTNKYVYGLVGLLYLVAIAIFLAIGLN